MEHFPNPMTTPTPSPKQRLKELLKRALRTRLLPSRQPQHTTHALRQPPLPLPRRPSC